MKIFDYVVPEQIAEEAVNCIKKIDNKTILENITSLKLSKGLGGIRAIPANIPLIRKKLGELIKTENEAGMVWIHEGAFYGKFTIVLSEKALIDGFEALENTYGSAPILLAMLLDDRESIREFAQKKCEQITEWKQAPESQEEAQKVFKEIFGPFIDEMSHLLNKPEIKVVVKEVKSELPPKKQKELETLRKEVKDLRCLLSDAYSVENELKQQKDKAARLEAEKALVLEKDKELRQENKQLLNTVDRLNRENRKLFDRINYLEEKVDAVKQSKKNQQENYELRLKQANETVFDSIYIQETKKIEEEKNPAAELFSQHSVAGFFRLNDRAILIIDGHNVLNCEYYTSLSLEHDEKRALLAQNLEKLLSLLPKLEIRLFFDSDKYSINNHKSERFKKIFSGGEGEHRADREITKEYDRSLLAEEKFIFVVTDDRDIRDYCIEAGIISSTELIRLITKEI